MGKKIWMGLLLALLIPYVVTLAWTGKVRGEPKVLEVPSGKRILLDQGGERGYIDLEEYLPGAVARQIPPDYGREALKAQAIIARTYIYKQMGDKDQIPQSALHMGYLEEKQLKDMWGSQNFVSFYNNIQQAVKDTRGKVITWEGKCIDPLFHRASAGRTRAGDQAHPYLQSVACPRDVEADHYLSLVWWSKEDFVEKINAIQGGGTVTASQVPETIQMVSRDDAGYVSQIQIGTKTYQGEEVQKALGLNSSCFTLEGYDGGIRAICKGIGHGYGLSQYGAKVKAQEGWKAEDILGYFYKNIAIISE